MNNDPWLERDIPAILAEYRRQLEMQGEQELKTLVEHYEIPGHDKPSYIDALVAHYKAGLEKEGYSWDTNKK